MATISPPPIVRGRSPVAQWMASALVLLAQGAEEIETVSVVDTLRRGHVEVVLAGLDGPGEVKCSRGVRLVPDSALADVAGRAFDMIVCPGGKEGAERLAASSAVGALLQRQVAAGGKVAAVCAATTVLQAHGIMHGCRVTSHPSVRDAVTSNYQYVDEARVVVDRAGANTIITSRGPGTSIEFALAILSELQSPAAAQAVAGPMLLPAGAHIPQ